MNCSNSKSLFLLLLLCGYSSYSQWVDISPTGFFPYLSSVDVLSPSSLFVGADSGRVLRSTTAGANWEYLYLPTNANVVQVDFINSQVGWVSTTDGLYSTTNEGMNWQRLTSELRNPLLAQDQSNIFAGSYRIITGGHGANWKTPLFLHSTNGGNSWNSVEEGSQYQITGSLFFWDSLHGLASTAMDPYIGGSLETIYSTTNGGVTWNVLSHPFFGGIFSLMFVDNSNGWALFGIGPYGAPSNMYTTTDIVRTTDGGVSWSISKHVGFKVSSLFFADALHGWACGNGGVIFQTTDGGNNWDSLMTTPRKDLSMIRFADNLVGYAVGADGTILKTTTGGVLSVEDQSQNVPLHVCLYQSYPNPFNPSTTISYALPHSSHVTLTVFSTLGHKVATLVSENQTAGEHSTTWNAEGYATGVYYCRLQAGGFVQTKKLVLVK